jgi:hypothetical protein
MDLGSSLFERDLIHRPLHELDTSAMLGQEVSRSCRIGNRGRIKSIALIRDD